MRGKWSARRVILGALGAAALFGPAIFSGCASNFTPEGKIETLRVLAVTLDHPYVPDNSDNPDCADKGDCALPPDCPGDAERCTVHFNMEVYDAYGVRTQGAERKINILWMGGCFNPPGDQYSLCAIPLLGLFQQAQGAVQDALKSGKPPVFPPGLPVGLGNQFSMVVPDIVSSRPKPMIGPHYGIGYVFFLACAGYFGIIDPDPSAAGDFPIGCFDFDTKQPLGPDGFVPGYTQIYSFDDGRFNLNPEVQALTLEDLSADKPKAVKLDADADKNPTVPPCDVPADERYLPPSCTRQDAFQECTGYDIDVTFATDKKGDPIDPAEDDPDAKGEKGEQLTETVWVDYFSDTGDFDSDIKLVSDSQTGYQDKHSVKWIPPAEPGISTIWAVVRDARGGSSVIKRQVKVK